MGNVNILTLVGRLTKDPQARTVQVKGEDRAVCNFSVAVSNPFNRDETNYFDITVWGRQADACAQYLQKGREVFVTGPVTLETWENDGRSGANMKVTADRVQFLGSKSDNEGSSGGGGRRDEGRREDRGRGESRSEDRGRQNYDRDRGRDRGRDERSDRYSRSSSGRDSGGGYGKRYDDGGDPPF